LAVSTPQVSQRTRGTRGLCASNGRRQIVDLLFPGDVFGFDIYFAPRSGSSKYGNRSFFVLPYRDERGRGRHDFGKW
jgi:hypothetical protein